MQFSKFIRRNDENVSLSDDRNNKMTETISKDQILMSQPYSRKL